MERDAQQVVVVGLLPHVDGDEVVEPLLVEEVLRLPADVGVWVQVLVVVVEEVLRLPADVWVQVLVVVEEVVRVLLPEHEPVALHEPQVAPA